VDKKIGRPNKARTAPRKRSRASADRGSAAAGVERVARPGRRSLGETAAVRARILDEAEKRFASRGYRGVSFRELGRAVGVRPFTIQHHFGSKLGLYSAVLSRWDGEVRGLVSGTLGSAPPGDLAGLIDRVVDELFEFFLARRAWVSLTARVALGEGLPPGAELEDHSWVRFMGDATRVGAFAQSGLDLRLLLITIEGILSNLVLSGPRYRQLFGGRDLDDPRLRAQVKSHLKAVLLRLWLPSEAAPAPRAGARRRGREPAAPHHAPAPRRIR
jgi:AcrR family transcriptional regulator